MQLNSLGRLVPVLPTGEEIPHIVKDSIEFKQDDREKKAGLVRVKLELFIWSKDIPNFEFPKIEIRAHG